MKTFAFYDTKPYDKIWFEKLKGDYDIEFRYIDNHLNKDTAFMAQGCEGVVVFVNDQVNKQVIEQLDAMGIKLIALRCAGYNNVDFGEAFGKIHVVRVPAYSPYAVAEHAMALLLTLNRRTHRAYLRTRDNNFSINGLTGFDLRGKTVGVVGTGKIGQIFIEICKGFGMEVIAYDPFPAKDSGITYVSFDELCCRAQIISLHCPLTESTHYIIGKDSLSNMQDGVIIINTSRGALIDSEALLNAIKTRKIGGAGLDVYEEETDIFFEDYSGDIINDDTLSLLISMPNVLVTSHQAFLTNEALENIADTTFKNIQEYYAGGVLTNEICYQCQKRGACKKDHKQRCF